MMAKQIGEYVIGQKLGEGSFCVTYRGQRTGGEAILKRIKPEFASIAKISERIRAQAISPPRVEHPLVAGLLTIVLDGDGYWLVRESASGEPLDLYCRKGSGRRLETTLPAFCRLLEAFGAAHRRGYYHGDLKPSNLWAESDGRFRVTDFEMSRLVGVSMQTRELLGTAETRAPELRDDADLDARTDIYALGVVLRQIVKGQPGVGAELRSVLDRATAPRDQRFRSAAEFREALLGCVPAPVVAAPAPVAALSTTPIEPPTPAPAANAFRTSWGLAGGVAAAVALGWGIWRTTGAEKTASAKSIVPAAPVVTSSPSQPPVTAVASKPAAQIEPKPAAPAAPAPKSNDKTAAAAQAPAQQPAAQQQAQAEPPAAQEPAPERPRLFVWNQKNAPGPAGTPSLPAGDPALAPSLQAANAPPVPGVEVRVSAPPPVPNDSPQGTPAGRTAAPVSGRAVGARLLRGGSPTYPSLARQMRVSGTVRLEIQVDERGNVSGVKALTGHPVLSGAAMEAARRWTYSPATLDGKPITSVTQVDISFTSR